MKHKHFYRIYVYIIIPMFECYNLPPYPLDVDTYIYVKQDSNLYITYQNQNAKELKWWRNNFELKWECCSLWCLYISREMSVCMYGPGLKQMLRLAIILFPNIISFLIYYFFHEPIKSLHIISFFFKLHVTDMN